ncbi:hypothetical protein ANCCAN_06115 [Ancylostoma caninum]|uniref:Uncharacterized protein n=1 Tax=Ancylostoma caninum TaxID=29170 RepID=A0A368GW19_ANCCA|nr:hypothetical protein ANCCAN_06115 [Ancylostoma caninum]
MGIEEENGSSSLTSNDGAAGKKSEKLDLSHENVESEGSMDTTSTSTSPTSSGSPRTGETVSTTTTSRMENGEPIPRLAPGIYHKKPAPILTDAAIPFSSDVL